MDPLYVLYFFNCTYFSLRLYLFNVVKVRDHKGVQIVGFKLKSRELKFLKKCIQIYQTVCNILYVSVKMNIEPCRLIVRKYSPRRLKSTRWMIFEREIWSHFQKIQNIIFQKSFFSGELILQ